jgi:N-methylhydantoinase B
LAPGDIVREETAGGGGHGDPLERDPARVADDVAGGYLTSAQARARYGVVFDTAGAVDAKATRDMREVLNDARLFADLEASNEDELDGPRRRFTLSRELARRLGVDDGVLIELCGAVAAPLRGWVRVTERGTADVLGVGPETLSLLGAKPGDRVELRAVSATPALVEEAPI